MYLLGFDIGSSSIKASLIDGQSGNCLASAFYPKQEMKITAVKPGWAEQEPEQWWANLKLALAEVMGQSKVDPKAIDSIGISYQMHGLVAVDKNQQVLRPSIIWCDSRAAEIGNKAFSEIGEEKCLSNLLNSPGNFTASKLKWVKDNEPELYAKIDKIMLPGDYIAMKLTSNGQVFWAFASANESVNGAYVAHLWSYGLNTWGWEDLYGGGDRDYNDLIVQLDFTSTAGAGLLV